MISGRIQREVERILEKPEPGNGEQKTGSIFEEMDRWPLSRFSPDRDNYQMSPTLTLPVLSADTIYTKRSAVRERVSRESSHFGVGDLEGLSAADLHLLFGSYDDLFFQNQLSGLLTASGSQILFDVSKRMTSAGANITRRGTKSTRRVYRIAVSAPVLFASFRRTGDTPTANGVVCTDRTMALQVLMEHEFVHLYEMLTTGKSNHGSLFKKVALDLFGHTDFRHNLVTVVQQASERLGVRLGEQVGFSFRGSRMVGKRNAVNRRATVLVPHRGGAEYKDGQKYLKFYVPVSSLQKVKRT